MKRTTKSIYLDHAATTPTAPEVVKAMQPYWSNVFANPSALYRSGKRAGEAMNSARNTIASILNCKPAEIIFTSGGTESNNMAIHGFAKAYVTKHHKPGHIISTKIEHHAVLHVLDALENWGWKISYAPVNAEGFVNLDGLKKLVQKDTALISVMYANNEVGTIEPIEEIGKWITGLNKVRVAKKLSPIYFHSDACQAAGALNLSVNDLKVDLLTINGSKIYGPKGIGLLYIRGGTPIEPILYGGGQERNLRSGTENVPAIVGFAKALELAQKNTVKENKRLTSLRNYFVDRLSKKVKGLVLNGPAISATVNRLPNNINISFPNIEGETLMLYLDAKGVAVSTGSACATSSTDPSHVLEAIGVGRSMAYNAIRITLGRHTTKQELNIAISAIVNSINIINKTL